MDKWDRTIPLSIGPAVYSLEFATEGLAQLLRYAPPGGFRMRTLDNARAIARLRARERLRELLAEEARLLASLRRPRRAAHRVHYELDQIKKPTGGRDGAH